MPTPQEFYNFKLGTMSTNSQQRNENFSYFFCPLPSALEPYFQISQARLLTKLARSYWLEVLTVGHNALYLRVIGQR